MTEPFFQQKAYKSNIKNCSVSITPKTISDTTQRISISVKGFRPKKLSISGRDLSFFEKRGNGISNIRTFIGIEDLTKGDFALKIENEEIETDIPVTVAEDVIVEAKRLFEIKRKKLDWLRQNTCCPECKQPLDYLSGRAECRNGHQYEQTPDCINMISSKLGADNKLSGGEFVSRHRLSSISTTIIEKAKAKGGYVLDMGAGLKFSDEYLENVINLEIESYPTTDILAVGQKLPFPDNTFDAILCFAVLEHVSDPFACAREMSRVLKPGGELCVGVPFIFEEHGYPEHYYNMTRRGVANLFEDRLEITQQTPGNVFLPLLVKQYLSVLPEEKARTVRNLTLGEIADAPINKAVDMVGMPDLSNDARFRFALGSYLWAVKREVLPT